MSNGHVWVLEEGAEASQKAESKAKEKRVSRRLLVTLQGEFNTVVMAGVRHKGKVTVGT